MFSKIKIDTISLIFDPCLKMLCIRNLKQNKILETVEDRFLKELDVVQLLHKLRDSYDLLSKMQPKK